MSGSYDLIGMRWLIGMSVFRVAGLIAMSPFSLVSIVCDGFFFFCGDVVISVIMPASRIMVIRGCACFGSQCTVMYLIFSFQV